MYQKSARVVELPTVWMQKISSYFGIENEFVQFVFSNYFRLCLACQHQNLLPVSVDVKLPAAYHSRFTDLSDDLGEFRFTVFILVLDDQNGGGLFTSILTL